MNRLNIHFDKHLAEVGAVKKLMPLFGKPILEPPLFKQNNLDQNLPKLKRPLLEKRA